MLYRARSADEVDGADGVCGTPLVVERSVFAPSPSLWAAWRAGSVGGERFRRSYVRELRERYRAEPRVWADLAEQAGAGDVCLVGEPAVTAVVYECVVRVGEERGLLLDPEAAREVDGLDLALLESRRRKVLEREGVRVKSELERMGEVAPPRGKGRYR